MLEENFLSMPLPDDLKTLLAGCPGWVVPRDRQTILQLAMGGKSDVYEVVYDESL